MHDSPSAADLLAEVRRVLDDGALAPGFAQKVAANALGIALREMALGPEQMRAERARLASLVGEGIDCADENRALAETIRSGTIDPADPDLLDHLIRTTVAKLDVDQPAYPAFRRWREQSA